MLKIIIKKTISIACIILSVLLFSVPCRSFENPSNVVSWHISASKLSYNQKKDLYIASGDVLITGGKTRLQADYVQFSNTTMDVLASGHVLLISGLDTITCNSLKLNLATQIGTIYRGTVFIKENHFYIRGNKIQKTGKATYYSDSASITSCSGKTPAWKIKGKNVKITIEGYGYASNVTLWAKKLPVLYTPFIVFPGKTKRQTGLLIPRIAFSDRKGFEYEQPLFLALSRSSDATFYSDYMGKRGLKLGVEYRYILNNESKGTLFYDYLKDRKVDDGTPATYNFSYMGTPIRTNHDRYWFRMKNDQALGDNWNAKLNMDIVSDADYLHEFRDGYTGFDATQKYFDDIFGRSLDNYTDTTRRNNLSFNKIWSNNRLNMSFDWYDNVIARSLNQTDTTLQTLPSIEFYKAKQQISKTPLYFDFYSDYKNFYRKDTNASLVRGQRGDIYPKIYLPFRFRNYLSIEPSAGIRETIWYSDEFKDPLKNRDALSHREIYDLNLKLSTSISKIFNPDNSFAEKIKHEIVPEIDYLYIPDVAQNNLPYFDSVDRIAKQNIVTWSLINKFTSREKSPVLITEKEQKFNKSQYIYREFTWIKLFQSFDINKANSGDPHPFSDISAYSEFSPDDYISINADAAWSPYDNEFTSSDTGISLKDNRGDILHGEYRYKKLISDSLYTRFDINITTNLNAWISYETNFLDNKRIETLTGFDLHKSCWSFILVYDDKPGDRSFAFVIHLSGIGDLGTK